MATKAKKEDKKQESVETDVLPVLTSFVETDCVGFDLAISNGKGLPEGGNILLFGNPGCGKSTLISDVIRRLLIKHEVAGLPYRIVYIDSENSLTLLNCIGKNPKDPAEMGLQKYITVVPMNGEVEYKPQQLIYYPNVCTFTKTEEIYQKYIMEDDVKENKDVKIIIVDSLSNLVSTTLQEAAVDKADYGSNAKERSRFYGKWLGKARDKRITTIYTSQVRQKQGATAYEDPNRPAVTEADRHQMDVIMKLTKSTDSKRVALKKIKQKTIDGVVEVQPRYILKLSTKKAAQTKNRIWDAVDVEILVKHGNRVLNAFTLFNMLEQNNLYIRLNATTYTVSETLAAAFPQVDFGDLEKGMPKKQLNALTSQNMGRLVEYLRDNGIYTATVGEVEDLDDGLYV